MNLLEFLNNNYFNIQYHKRTGVFKNKNLSYYNEIIERTKFLEQKARINERIYCITHNITEIKKCEYCNEKLRYFNSTLGYSKTCAKQECIRKHKHIIEENGKTIVQNAVARAAKTMQNTFLENGLTIAQNLEKKRRNTCKNTIDRFGRNLDQLRNFKRAKTLRNSILQDGTNKLQLCSKRMHETKSKIKEDGLSLYHSCSIRAANTMKTTILENGLNIHQNAYLKRRDKSKCFGIRTRHYNERLFYQSIGEKNFLDKVAEFGLLDQIDNGNTIKYYNVENEVKNYYPDFSLKNIIYEIKSKWTYDKSGKCLDMRIKNNLKLKGAVDSKHKVFLIIDNKAKELKAEDFSDIATDFLASQDFVMISKEMFLPPEGPIVINPTCVGVQTRKY
jgi:hypothetical protein